MYTCAFCVCVNMFAYMYKCDYEHLFVYEIISGYIYLELLLRHFYDNIHCSLAIKKTLC